jgi:hypothetical protein
MKRGEYDGKDGGQDKRREKWQENKEHEHHDREQEAEEKI